MMKQWICKGLLFGFLSSLLSCASTMNLFIDVEKPAAITLPVAAQNVIIVNNALSQPMGHGLSAPSGKYPEDDSLYVKTLKTASWKVAMEAFKYLDNSKFFSEVSFYKKALREDNEWLTVVPVKKEVREDFLKNENYDLLISIDRVLFHSSLESNKVSFGKMESLLTFSVYLSDKDSVFFHSIGDSIKAYYSDIFFDRGVPLINSEEMNTEMIRQSAYNLGEKLGKFFVPVWEAAERIYFIKNYSDASKMAGYIKHGKWNEAKTSWTNAFETAKKTVEKAKLATNITLAYEMTDEFTTAETWAKQAKTFFQSASATKYAKEITYLDEYIKVLQEREQNNVKLNEQYGISKER